MDKRKHLLERCISAFVSSKYSDMDIFCYYQGSQWANVRGKEVFKDVVIDPNPRGVFTPRYELMKRYAHNYDYTILIDDDLFIGPDTKYFDTIRFLESSAGKNVGACTTMNTKRFVRNEIRIVSTNDDINVSGGMVIRRAAILDIIKYFSSKEADYTFDVFWILLYIKGWDLARDYRSFAEHRPVVKINGEHTGFNSSLVGMPYVPIMSEWIREPKMVFRHGRQERETPTLKDINAAGLAERKMALECKSGIL